MQSLDGLVRFVNGQRDRLHKIVADHPTEERSRKTLPTVARRFDEVIAVLEQFQKQQSELEAARSKIADLELETLLRKSSLENLEIGPKDLEGLPAELIEQLSISESDREEFQILGLLQAHGGTMSLDQLLIAIYRKSKEILERSKLNQRLYRMASKSILFSVPGRKGIYTIYEPEEVEKKKPAG
jgi:hypothetical protein